MMYKAKELGRNSEENELDVIRNKLEELNKIKPYEITFKITPVEKTASSKFWKEAGVDKDITAFNLEVTFSNEASLIHHLVKDSEAGAKNFTIDVIAYDVGYQDGQNKRKEGEREIKIKQTLTYELSGSSLSSNFTDGDRPLISISNKYYKKQVKDCAGDTSYFGAFEPQDWEEDILGEETATSFTPQTRLSWSFTEALNDSATETELMIQANSEGAGGFYIKSIVNKCTVAANVSFIAGFFGCDKFEILHRTTPLEIIGTVLTSSLEIDDSALEQGITWSSIYHSDSYDKLIKHKILERPPLGHANRNSARDIEDLVITERTNVKFLRDRADPFTWTTVDPDCGILKDDSKSTCKRQIRRFYVIEYKRDVLDE